MPKQMMQLHMYTPVAPTMSKEEIAESTRNNQIRIRRAAGTIVCRPQFFHYLQIIG
jgi:hypothetical protein